MQHLVRPEGLPPVNGFSHAVIATGTIVHISGQVPADPAGTVVGPSDAAAQCEQVFANLEAALSAAGCSIHDVVKMTYFLVDLADLPAIRAVRDRHIDATKPPASTLVQVAALVNPGFLIEIDATAVIATR